MVRSIPEADPARFLSAAEGSPRGFWGRGNRWVAWMGAAAEFRVADGEGAGSRNGAGGDRYEEVRRALQAALPSRPGGWDSCPPEDRPRAFGGFSFLERAGEDRAWEGFPPARFVLPRLLLEGRDGRYRLVAQLTRADAAGGPEEARGRLDALLDAGEAMLRPDPGSHGTGDEGRALPSLAVDPSRRSGVRPVDPGRPAWDQAVETILSAIRRSELEKAVLARIRDVHLDADVEAAEALRFLRAENHRAHVYLMELDPGRILMGAAPEILAELRGREFHATAVAGSAPRGATFEADADRARGLLASAKDRAEHRVTVEEMQAGLDGRMVRLAVPGAPRVLTLARIQHLETPIRGQVGPDSDVLSLVRALHPTPAVCGRPTDAALELLRAAEPFGRGWYAGPVGWFDPGGDGDFVPALRSAVGGGRQWRLFAGAGIVEGSDPGAEWEETALKFEPAMKALLAGCRTVAEPQVGSAPDGAS